MLLKQLLPISVKSIQNAFKEPRVCLKLTFSVRQVLNRRPTLKEYQSIRQREGSNTTLKQEDGQNSNIESRQLKPLNDTAFQKNQTINKKDELTIPENIGHRCEGCNVFLQTTDRKKYGFIDERVYKRAIDSNQKVISETYGERIERGDVKVRQLLGEVQKQLGVQIFPNTKSQISQSKQSELQNLDDVSVLLRIQEKIDRFEQQNQTLKRSKSLRKQIYCYRCHSLKYNNYLPQQYDDITESGGLSLDKEIVLKKVFKKHEKQDVYYLYVVDCLDILGSLREQLVFSLLDRGLSFGIVLNKSDLINKKYLAQNLIHADLRRKFHSILLEYEKNQQKSSQPQSFSAQDTMRTTKLFFVSSISREGVKKIEDYMGDSIKRIQLFGLPNTGKTTLLNKLLKSDKITSRIPGTTVRISEHTYRSKVTIFDMPGLHYPDLLYNCILKPSQKALLTWSKSYSPPLMTHHCFFFGGKVEAQGLRIVLFGMGGACTSDNRWFMLNHRDFWKGLKPLSELKIKRYEEIVTFERGKGKDLQIAGYGFIGFKPAMEKSVMETKIVFYLPEGVTWRFRDSVLNNETIFHNKSAFTKKHQLHRISKNSQVV